MIWPKQEDVLGIEPGLGRPETFFGSWWPRLPHNLVIYINFIGKNMGTSNKDGNDVRNYNKDVMISNIIEKQRRLWAGILLLTAFLLGLSPAYGAGTITENFANNQYNTKLWYLYNSD
jgi:hypothetical protein